MPLTIYKHHTPLPLFYSNDATEMAIDCVSVCEMETVMSLTPDFLAADSASPWSCRSLVSKVTLICHGQAELT